MIEKHGFKERQRIMTNKQQREQREKREAARLRARFLAAADEIRRALAYSVAPPSRIAAALHELALRQYGREKKPAVWIARYRKPKP